MADELPPLSQSLPLDGRFDAGAITLLPQGGRPEPVGGDVEWLDEAGLAELLTELPSRPS